MRKIFKILKNSPQEKIEETDFIVLDTETTGLKPEKDRIISISAVALKDNKIFTHNIFEKYIEQPKIFYKKKTSEIHGILHNSKQIDFQNEKKVLLKFKKYVENKILIGHHVGFDMQIINASLKRNKIKTLKNKHLDTCILFKRLLYKTKNKIKKTPLPLDELCEHFKIQKDERHTATGDAYITAIAFVKIIKTLNKNKKLLLKDLFKIPFYIR